MEIVEKCIHRTQKNRTEYIYRNKHKQTKCNRTTHALFFITFILQLHKFIHPIEKHNN